MRETTGPPEPTGTQARRNPRHTKTNYGFSLIELIITVAIIAIIAAVAIPIFLNQRKSAERSTIVQSHRQLMNELTTMASQGTPLPSGATLNAQTLAAGWKPAANSQTWAYPNCTLNGGTTGTPSTGDYITLAVHRTGGVFEDIHLYDSKSGKYYPPGAEFNTAWTSIYTNGTCPNSGATARTLWNNY